MSEVSGSSSWREDFVSLVDHPGVQYAGDGFEFTEKKRAYYFGGMNGSDNVEIEAESFPDQVKGFLTASGELLREFSVGCKEILRQTLGNEDSYFVKKFGGPCSEAKRKLEFLNEYLPEDKDPTHVWPVIFFVLFLAFSVLIASTGQKSAPKPPKLQIKLQLHPQIPSRIRLPDGRHIAYREQGVSADEARYSILSAHPFLSSRLLGIPGVSASLLEEFGVRFVTYDLPGFGESDPHPRRNLNSSARDMLHIAEAIGIKDKFWVLGYSGGALHAWAALRYIPERLAGAVLFAPMGNPYESSMTKDERFKIWGKWPFRKKFMFFVARKAPILLPLIYRRSFLSGRPVEPTTWLSPSLGKKDGDLVGDPAFVKFWTRDIEESTRQGNPAPFVEEAIMQVSNWGFSLADLQVQRKREKKGLLRWIRSMYKSPEKDWTGYPGPIHIWQGMDDRVVPPAMSEYARRVVPGATLHRLTGEGHFSYFCFCDECHRKIFSVLFGMPQGRLNKSQEGETVTSLNDPVEISLSDTREN